MVTNLKRHVQVTAALIPVSRRLFIAQRPPQKKFGLLWEFPGGKVESGESLQDSLVREIREELCWDIRVGELFQQVLHRYLDFHIELYAFWCTISGGRMCLREHVAYAWPCLDELGKYRFTLADRELVFSLEKLSRLPETVLPSITPV